MPQKIRDLLRALKEAGFEEIAGAGKGSHRKLVHPKYAGAVTLSGKARDDAKERFTNSLHNSIYWRAERNGVGVGVAIGIGIAKDTATQRINAYAHRRRLR